MEQKVVSVIVAAYKVEDYLEQCVQSILDQSYRNLEIILVDDGSPDKSPQICDGFARKDKRVRVIHKKNEGIVYARRDGLLCATGEFVLLMDGDDFADPEYIESLVAAAVREGADVAADSFLMSYPEEEDVEKIYFPPGTYRGDKLKKLKQHVIYSGKYYQFGINPALWNKLFRRDKLLQYYKGIPQSITLGEDFVVSMPYMANAESIVILDSKSYYHYRQRPDSMVRAYNAKLGGNINLLLKFLEESSLAGRMDGQLMYYYSWLLLEALKNAMKSAKSLQTQAKALKSVYNDFIQKDIVRDLKGLPAKYGVAFYLLKHNHFLLLAAVLRFAKG